jgi:hypothetical protein
VRTAAKGCAVGVERRVRPGIHRAVLRPFDKRRAWVYIQDPITRNNRTIEITIPHHEDWLSPPGPLPAHPRCGRDVPASGLARLFALRPTGTVDLQYEGMEHTIVQSIPLGSP